MFLTRIRKLRLSLFYCIAVLAITAAFLVFVNNNMTPKVAAQDDTGPVLMSPAAAFPANPASLGAIPDGPGTCDAAGAPRNVTFTVTGISGPPTNVSLAFTISPTHTYVGDLDLLLKAPNGTTTHFIFTGTGNTVDSSNLTGPYEFNDAAAGNWWTTAASGDTNFVLPAGSYRTSNSTGALTLMNPVFAGIPTSNGTWTAEFTDWCAGDIGGVSAATLTLTGAAAPVTDALADFDGDGTTDYATNRAAPGINGQATWHVNLNASGNFYQFDWGLASDFFVPADLNGDGKDDHVVWRPGVQSTFYALLSGTNTILIDDFGLAGDDPSVIGDYDGDGDDELAVYRSGVAPGAQSSTFWKSTSTYNRIDWGITGDETCNADYDGDNKVDFCVQRGNVFHRRFTGGGADSQTTLGLAGDIVAPGDYDGDGKADLAVISPVGGFWQWTYKRSIDGANVVDTWGVVATDDPAPGDYTGDGKMDYGVWRLQYTQHVPCNDSGYQTDTVKAMGFD